MNRAFIIVLAIALVLIGLFVPAPDLIRFLRGDAATTSDNLAMGAKLFKIGLIVIGSYAVALGFLPRQSERRARVALAEASPIETLAFAGLILLATALRLYSLDVGIWYDEMLTHVRYMPLTVGQIVSTFDDANNHILFSVLARISLFVFGDSVWAFRLPAALFGIGSIIALYYLARRVTSVRESLFCAALLTLSFHHIWFSQNARGYTALLFFSILSSSWLIDAIRQNRRGRWVLYAVAAALGAFTHLTMGFVVIAHFVIYLGALAGQRLEGKGSAWDGLLFGFIPVGLLTIQLHALILPSMVGGSLLNSGLQGAESEWTNPIWALMELANGLQVGFSNIGVGLVAVAIFTAGLLDLARKQPAIVALFLVPTVLGLLVMTSIGYTLFPRFFFFAMGFGVIIVMHGAALTGRFLGRMFGLAENGREWVSASLCVAIVAVSVLSLRYVYAPKQAYEAAIARIESDMRPGDVVVTVGIADFPFNGYYHKGWENVLTVDDLDAIRARTDRTWLVYTMPVQANSAYPELLAAFEADYTPVDKFFGTLNGGEIVVGVEKTAAGS
ncbi:MAG: glycosyltransferase family 39 protein [Paracoccaceae bacterium]